MGTELNDLVGSQITTTLDGKEWTFSPLTIMDLAEYENHLQLMPFEKMAAKFKALGTALTPTVEKALLDAAEAESKEYMLNSKKGGRYMLSMEGSAYMLWLSLRKVHKDVTREQARSLLSQNNLKLIQEIIDRASGMSTSEGKAGSKKKPKPRQ